MRARTPRRRAAGACALVAVLAICGCEGKGAALPSPTAAIDAALASGGRYLASRQRGDGAIPSTTYAALDDGWSLTPLAALALRMVPEPQLADGYRRAVDYIATIAAPGGALREAPEVGYPLYAYAIGALVLGAPDNRRHAAVHARLLEALRTLQLGERNGWRPGDASYGGWGYAPRPVPRPDDAMAAEAYGANLSATLLAIGALVLGGTRPDDPALVAARGFVERCRNTGDGGFFFSPAVPDGNKAGATADGRYRSYGSMSADGMRALFRLGAPAATAAAYVTRNFDATRNPGDFPPIAEVRRASSYYYWAWSAAHVIRHVSALPPAVALAGELLRRQRPDGSWSNPSSEMRENDPIIATSFAVAALALARSVISREPRSHAY
ncbi:MAG: terpene cyclase/mutase family protein [Deltaproteobacteria bacterium]|nr:terpene cyclase/mutase family protein [Deltaproteobacteria bacterium]